LSESGQPSQGQPSNGSPLDGRDQQSAQRQESPEGPQDDPLAQEKPKDGKDPKGNKEDQNTNPLGNQPTNTTPGSETEAASAVAQDSERWGELPVYVRDLFRAEGGEDMPAEYRDWIDAYYRRLNARSGN
jgi:hypothetical protein